MNTLVELIKRIGIFMIAAQAVIHFTPGQKYEKYIKLLVGMIILLQFVMPLHDILSGAETDLGTKIADMEKMFALEGMTEELIDSSSVADSVINSLENEIKSKLNNEVSGENYVVSNVQVYMKISDGSGAASYGGAFDWQKETGTRVYELDKVRVAVYRRTVPADVQTDGNAGNAIEKVQIEKINIGSMADSGGAAFGGMNKSDGTYMEETEETAAQLRERFCAVLGMDAEKMEVSVYGTNEKTD